MNKKPLFAIAAIVALGAALAAYLYWPRSVPQPVAPQAITLPPPAPIPAPAPVASQAAEAPPAPPLPPLAKSDGTVLDALAALVENPSLMKLFHSDKIIHNIVVTIDDLPQQRLPAKVMPFRPPAGRFTTAGRKDNPTTSARNAKRYENYVKLAQTVDAKKLVALYVRLYPLFQQAYQDLGYPNGNFNNQLNDTLDDLLDTPDIKGPIRLNQPKYFYLYADADTEARSVGQKIMLRLGGKDEAIVKAKLREIKQELALHADELGTAGTR